MVIFSRTSQEQYDTDEMAKEFLYSFPNQMFTVGQQLAFQFKDKKMLILLVKDIEGKEVLTLASYCMLKKIAYAFRWEVVNLNNQFVKKLGLHTFL